MDTTTETPTLDVGTTRRKAPRTFSPAPGELGSLERVMKESGDLGRSTVLELASLGLFPAAIPLTPRRVAWVMDEVRAWREARIAEARGGDPKAFARRVKEARTARKARGQFVRND